MPRRHLFAVVVLLGAAAVAGLLAVTRTVALGSPEHASSNEDAAISFRLQRLDRLEASLRKELASQGAPAPAPATVYRRATTLAPRVDDESDADEHEHGSGDFSDDEDSDSSYDEDRDD